MWKSAVLVTLALAACGSKEKDKAPEAPVTCEQVIERFKKLEGSGVPDEVTEGAAKVQMAKCVGNKWTQEQLRCAMKSTAPGFVDCGVDQSLPPGF